MKDFKENYFFKAILLGLLLVLFSGQIQANEKYKYSIFIDPLLKSNNIDGEAGRIKSQSIIVSRMLAKKLTEYGIGTLFSVEMEGENSPIYRRSYAMNNGASTYVGISVESGGRDCIKLSIPVPRGQVFKTKDKPKDTYPIMVMLMKKMDQDNRNLYLVFEKELLRNSLCIEKDETRDPILDNSLMPTIFIRIYMKEGELKNKLPNERKYRIIVDTIAQSIKLFIQKKN